jgi:hypothetical protein
LEHLLIGASPHLAVAAHESALACTLALALLRRERRRGRRERRGKKGEEGGEGGEGEEGEEGGRERA